MCREFECETYKNESLKSEVMAKILKKYLQQKSARKSRTIAASYSKNDAFGILVDQINLRFLKNGLCQYHVPSNFHKNRVKQKNEWRNVSQCCKWLKKICGSEQTLICFLQSQMLSFTSPQTPGAFDKPLKARFPESEVDKQISTCWPTCLCLKSNQISHQNPVCHHDLFEGGINITWAFCHVL